jgi:RNA-directed DNA polymerase
MINEKKKNILNLLKSGESIDEFITACNIYIKEIENVDLKNRNLLEKKLVLYLYHNIDKQYSTFEIKKKSGGERIIYAPKSHLKYLQKNIAKVLSLFYVPTDFCHGFVSGRSIVTNAEIHTNKNYVLNVDLHNFFPSIGYKRINDILMSDPFGFSEKISKIIARFSTLNGALPQGSPVSPLLSNICCSQLDYDLNSFAIKNKLVYSRYADDITFSGYRMIFDSNFFKDLNRIIRKKNNLKLNKSKTRIQSKNKRQEVTGIVVNDKLNVNRIYIRNLRALIHNYKMGKAEKNAQAVISGKLEFLKMIKGKDRVYRNLLSQFKKTPHE